MADGHPNTSLNARSSSSSGGGGGGGGGAARSSHRSLPHDRQLSQIERSVGHLLVATKQLLETLTQWSRQQASETEVSDVYVRLGYEFNLACRAFQSIGVDTSDLGPVPDMLRTILEDTLSQEALPESLERYLPRIRDIIINLLHGLKRKQTRLRSRTQQQLQQSQREREREASRAAADGQQASVRRDSGGNAEPGVAAAAAAAVPGAGAGQEAGIEPPAYLPPQSPSSPDPAAAAAGRSASAYGDASPPRNVIRQTNSSERNRPGGAAGGGGGSYAEREAYRRESNSRSSPQSSLSNLNTTPTIAAPAATSAASATTTTPVMPRQPRYSPQSLPPSSSSTHPGPGSFPAPPPPPPPALITAKQADALGLLQRTGELERRASRRFSAYQIQKHLGTPPTGMIPMPMPGLPSSIGASSQPPLPARMGGVGAAGAGSRSEVRESLNAVRLRGAQGQGQAGSVRGHRAGTGPGPGTAPEYVRRGAEEEGSVPFASGSSSSAARAGGMPRSQSTTTASSSSASNPRTRPSGENIATTLNQPPSMERLRQAEYSTSVSNGPESPRKHRPMSPAQAGDGPGDVIMGGLNEATTATSGLGPAVSATHPPYHYTSADPYAQNPAASASSSSLPPQQSRGLTLFLQYKHRIKKYVLPEGLAGLTIGRLQLAFIEKFAWNTHNNGADLPEIYVQDPASGVRHELEDLADVKDRSVLVLNIEPLDEVKRHFDEQVRGVKTLLEGVQSLVETQGSAIQQIGEQQSATAKELAERLVVAAAPSVPPASASASSPSVASASPAARIPGASATAAKRLSSAATAADVASDDSPRLASITATSADGLDEIRSVRRDLAVLRQIYTSFSSDIANSMSLIRKKADGVKIAAATATTPSYEGDAGRAHIAAGKKTLADESEKLVARVDDLQDLVEDLRKDVVSRGVRPLPRQLEAVGRDIAAVTKELKKMQEFLKKEKPIWTKIWEKELQLVCEERDQLTMQEDLAVDLEDDLEKAAQTFALVEQATKQQQQQMSSSSSSPAASPGLHSGGGTGFGSIGMRSISRGPFPPSSSDAFGGTATDLARVKDSVLGEVKALQPNHQTRLDAIERAERARQKELEDRRVGKFQKELGKFVSEGRLKKSGGVDEAERVRRSKDEQIRKEAWEAEMARKAESVASGGSPTKVASPLSQTQTQSQDDEQDGDADNKQTPAVDSEGGEHLGTSDFTESGEKQGQNRGGDAATDPEAAAAMDDAAPEESASSQPGEGTAAGTVAPPAASDS